MGKKEEARGGHGGAAEVIGGYGTAKGGRGGRGGTHGRGGDGGSAKAQLANQAIGGDGGDAGRPNRPTLGAASVLERLSVDSNWPINNLVDQYGIYMPGRGGDSGVAFVKIDGREYSMNVLLRLLQIWNSIIIDTIDEMEVKSPQDWWDKAMLNFPSETEKAVEHMKFCEDVAPVQGVPPKSPYK